MAVQLPDTEYIVRAPRDEVAAMVQGFWEQMIDDGYFDGLGRRFQVGLNPGPLERDGYRFRTAGSVRTPLLTTVNLEIVSTLCEIDGGKHTRAVVETSMSGLGAGTVARALRSLIRPVTEHLQSHMARGLEKYIADRAKSTAEPSRSVEF